MQSGEMHRPEEGRYPNSKRVLWLQKLLANSKAFSVKWLRQY
jgi:hypothetical protein